MTKHDIITRLLALPGEIAIAEDKVLDAHSQVVKAKELLQQKEDDLLLGDEINGKNAEIRAAQMRKYTGFERETLAETEHNLKNAAARLGRLKDELRALEAVSGLLQGVA